MDMEKLECVPNATIPTVFTDDLSYLEILGKINIKLNDVIETVNNQNEKIEDATNYMKENIESVASEIVTEKIANGEILVSLVYDSNTKDLSLKLYSAKEVD